MPFLRHLPQGVPGYMPVSKRDRGSQELLKTEQGVVVT